MDIRYSAHPEDAKPHTTQELRKEFLIDNLYSPDEVKAVYSHVDRMVVLGVYPVSKPLSIDSGIDIWKNFGTQFFLERREAGFFNLGGPGICSVDGTSYDMDLRDAIYITRGVKTVTFQSKDQANPARFYGVCAPAHQSYETKFITKGDAVKKHLGTKETANQRVLSQYIHPDVVKTCQLMMGLTALEPGNVWNTMPVHTHERRMEVYTYFDIPEEQAVFHFMGQSDETRHILVKNFDAVISPSWSIHSGCGTANYAFIWAMGGENQTFDDMDTIPTKDLR